MTSPQPFLSAGLPGLSFGLSLGRGLSIQLDPSDQSNSEESDLNPDEDILLIKNAASPSALLVCHIHGIHELTLPVFDQNEDTYIYVSLGIGATTKLTKLKLVQTKQIPLVVFKEVKYLPFLVSPLPKERMNKLVLSVLMCKAGEEHVVTKSKHKIVGRYETHTHKLLRNVTIHIDGKLLDKNGNAVGQVEMECCAVYGSFGYGQSYQLENSLHSPEDLVKMSLLPKIPPTQEQMIRGTLIKPKKLLHPSFLPLENEAVENLEPNISDESDREALQCPEFPLLSQHMQRIGQLQSILKKQTTRTKRISFLRKLLQDGGSVVSNSEFEEATDDEGKNKQAPIPPALALLMNATKFLAEAPGIIRRKARFSSASSDHEGEPSSGRTTRSYSVAPHDNMRDVEMMKDSLFARRRQSVAPNSS